MRTRLVTPVLLLCLLAACRGDPDRSPLKLAGDIPPPGPGYRNAFYQLLGTPFVEGNSVRWVWNGQIFDALAEEIGRARTSVDVVLYIWRHVVQDKLPMRLREEIPRTPEEARAHAELKAAPTSASR